MIFISLYLIGVIGAYTFFHRIYSKGGRWQNSNAEGFDVFAIFMPIVNLAVLITLLWKGTRRRKPLDYNKFFRVRK